MNPCRLLFVVIVPLSVQLTLAADEPKQVETKVKEIAGTAEFLRSVPKHFATLKAVDPARRQVTLLIEGEVLPKVWPLVPDAEVKVMGWWGRLDQFTLGDRVWVWFKTDRKKQAVAVSMLADEVSEQDIHGAGLAVEGHTAPSKPDQGGPPAQVTVKPVKGPSRVLTMPAPLHNVGEKVYVQSAGARARLLLTPEQFEARREQQKAE